MSVTVKADASVQNIKVLTTDVTGAVKVTKEEVIEKDVYVLRLQQEKDNNLARISELETRNTEIDATITEIRNL